VDRACTNDHRRPFPSSLHDSLLGLGGRLKCLGVLLGRELHVVALLLVQFVDVHAATGQRAARLRLDLAATEPVGCFKCDDALIRDKRYDVLPLVSAPRIFVSALRIFAFSLQRIHLISDVMHDARWKPQQTSDGESAQRLRLDLAASSK